MNYINICIILLIFFISGSNIIIIGAYFRHLDNKGFPYNVSQYKIHMIHLARLL